jgi:predicted lipid-binding transport protein (Tim44 family)
MAVRGTHNRDDIRGSDEARSVNKGLKQKELDDSFLTGGLIAGGFAGVIVGSLFGSWIVGGIVFFIFFALLGYWYYKE